MLSEFLAPRKLGLYVGTMNHPDSKGSEINAQVDQDQLVKVEVVYVDVLRSRCPVLDLISLAVLADCTEASVVPETKLQVQPLRYVGFSKEAFAEGSAKRLAKSRCRLDDLRNGVAMLICEF